MEDGTTESLHRFENLSWAWPVQAEVPGNHQLIYGRLAMEVLQYCFECKLIAVNVSDDSDTHMISLLQGDDGTTRAIR
jgi:hypothetical protein